MALTVTDVEQLRAYLCGVMSRADHHAGSVNEIALALVGAILWRKDDFVPCVGPALQKGNPYLPPICPLLGAPSLQTGYDVQCLKGNKELFAKHTI